MRLKSIRKASIPETERDTFERFGEIAVLTVLMSGFAPRAVELQPIYNDPDVRANALAWMTEKSDRKERREDWTLLMEIAITAFVGLELILSVIELVKK